MVVEEVLKPLLTRPETLLLACLTVWDLLYIWRVHMLLINILLPAIAHIRSLGGLCSDSFALPGTHKVHAALGARVCMLFIHIVEDVHAGVLEGAVACFLPLSPSDVVHLGVRGPFCGEQLLCVPPCT